MIRRHLRDRVARVLIAVALVSIAKPAAAYLKFGYIVNGRQETLRWTRLPLTYFVRDAGVSGVTPAEFQGAITSAFSTWESVPTASVAYTFGGWTSNRPGEDDGRSTLGFRSEPTLDRVLAATSFLVDGVTGELIESDVYFNSAFAWSAAAAGETGRWDVQSVAVHEIGHMSGLGHSAIGETQITSTGRRVLSSESVMFPIALGPGDITGRTLTADDVAGMSDLYPQPGFNDVTGSVSGTVTRGGRGVFGAHVVAFDPASGDVVGNFSLSLTGQFSIAGLRPGPHVIRVEPLDDVDTESFFDAREPVDTAFRVTYFKRLVVAPRGGDSGPVEIAVDGR